MIQQQFLSDPRAMVAEAPRGLPDTLPARLATETQQTTVALGYDASGRLVLEYQGPNFPPITTDPSGRDSSVYGLLVVDDTSQRVEGVLVYQTGRPAGFARLGTITGGNYTVPLYGARLNWASVNNPRCPLLGAAPPAGK